MQISANDPPDKPLATAVFRPRKCSLTCEIANRLAKSQGKSSTPRSSLTPEI